ncbi:hypothetical protein NC997_20970 [Trichocoleus sp. DQ-A2]|uniref:hypothetical protein n=1 Tax=Cyanophyceae TaxID=3028117 RepID=UPI001687E43D|nr:hypothetical protein [Coleofasciculus sp. FACHB-64]
MRSRPAATEPEPRMRSPLLPLILAQRCDRSHSPLSSDFVCLAVIALAQPNLTLRPEQIPH